MQTVLIVFHVLLAASLIGVVLLQRGAGAAMGAAFGAGASGTVFGARGSANFLTRSTTGLAIGFFTISLTLAVLAARGGPQQGQDDLGVVAPVPQAVEEMVEEEAMIADEPVIVEDEGMDFLDIPDEQADPPEDSIPDEEPPL